MATATPYFFARNTYAAGGSDESPCRSFHVIPWSDSRDTPPPAKTLESFSRPQPLRACRVRSDRCRQEDLRDGGVIAAVPAVALATQRAMTFTTRPAYLCALPLRLLSPIRAPTRLPEPNPRLARSTHRRDSRSLMIAKARDVAAPEYPAFIEDEVTPAADGPPNRWQQAHGSIAVAAHAPGRIAVPRQTKMDYGPTSARAGQRGGPFAFVVPDQVDFLRRQRGWNPLHLLPLE